MKCPHCTVTIFPDWEQKLITPSQVHDVDGVAWRANWQRCPGCDRYIVSAVMLKFGHLAGEIAVHPRSPKRGDLPQALLEEHPSIAADYLEAADLLSISAKASAALSRRCLQHLIREKVGIRSKDLYHEIEELQKQVPSWLAGDLHYPREIGNAAAHPLLNKHTGEIVDVEPVEAEWALSVLERLFDFFYAQPARSAALRVRLDAKKSAPGGSAPPSDASPSL